MWRRSCSHESLVLDVACLRLQRKNICSSVFFVDSETNDGGCVNDQQLRDFTNQFLHIPPQPVRQYGHCSVRSELEGDCLPEKSRYGLAEEPQNFTFTVINPAFSGTMRQLRVVRQLVPHHRSSVKVTSDGCVD